MYHALYNYIILYHIILYHIISYHIISYSLISHKQKIPAFRGKQNRCLMVKSPCFLHGLPLPIWWLVVVIPTRYQHYQFLQESTPNFLNQHKLPLKKTRQHPIPSYSIIIIPPHSIIFHHIPSIPPQLPNIFTKTQQSTPRPCNKLLPRPASCRDSPRNSPCSAVWCRPPRSAGSLFIGNRKVHDRYSSG